MLNPLPDDDSAKAQALLEQTANHILPILGFSSEHVGHFVRDHTLLPGQELSQLRLSRGQFALLKTRLPNTLQFEYVLPSNWHNRYQIVSRVMRLLKADANATGREILLWIDESFPSHNAYFMGLLPRLGFQLDPRVDLLSPGRTLEHLPLPPLPPGISERPFDPANLDSLNALYNQAFAVYPSRTPETDPLGHVGSNETTRRSFISLHHNGHPVALAFGSLPRSRYPALWNDRLNIEELAVHPDYVGRGLGRYLAIRCMQILRNLHPDSARGFFIGTDRTYTSALRLYHSLGFQPAAFYTYAKWAPR